MKYSSILLLVCLIISCASFALATSCPPVCRKLCRHGFQTDENGCAICRCRTITQELSDLLSPSIRCGPVCRMYCPYGFRTGITGCPVCACRSAPKRRIEEQIPMVDFNGRKCGPICRKHCKYGFIIGFTGCPVCACRSAP